MRKYGFEILTGLLIILGAGLVVITGYLSYQNITTILTDIRMDLQPEERLNRIKILATGMEKADNSLRIYAGSKDENDLKNYQSILGQMNETVDFLRGAAGSDKKFRNNIDTISQLVAKKIEVWNGMISLYDSDTAIQYLDTITREIESKIVSDSLRKNRSVFKKIFKREKKKELNESKIIRDIETYKSEDRRYALQLKEQELKLSATNSQITEKIYNLLKKMEADELIGREQKVKKADDLAKETFRWIGWLSFSAVALALLVIAIIVIYVRKFRASNRALLKARNEAIDLAKTKEHFIANVSHEIRTPLNAISGFIGQLIQQPTDPEIQDTLRILKVSSDHLVRVVNDILDFSKLQSGKLHLDPVHFLPDQEVLEVIQLYRNQAQEKKIDLQYDFIGNKSVALFGDSLRFRQILLNLLSNAIKFTPGGTIRISLELRSGQGPTTELICIVEDTGIGIEPAYLNRIFEDFSQAEKETTRKYGGTGLGLSIVKQLIDLQQGKIEVRSEKNKGTRFTCIIPFPVGNVDEIIDQTKEKRDFSGYFSSLNVLIADDEIYNRQLLKEILNKWNVRYQEAMDGTEAMEKVKNNVYDVIFMDLRMPGYDGMEITRYIRKTLKIPAERTQVVLTTAASLSAKDLNYYFESGIDQYLPKPFEEKAVISILMRKSAGKPVKNSGERREAKTTSTTGKNVIDLDGLYRIADQDQYFVLEMLETFIRSFESGLRQIEQSQARNDLPAISNAAHKMAPPCRHLGINGLLGQVKYLEELVRQQATPDEINNTFLRLRQEFEAIRLMIENYRNTILKNPENHE